MPFLNAGLPCTVLQISATELTYIQLGRVGGHPFCKASYWGHLSNPYSLVQTNWEGYGHCKEQNRASLRDPQGCGSGASSAVTDCAAGSAAGCTECCSQHLLAYLSKSHGSQLLKVNWKSKAKSNLIKHQFLCWALPLKRQYGTGRREGDMISSLLKNIFIPWDSVFCLLP